MADRLNRESWGSRLRSVGVVTATVAAFTILSGNLAGAQEYAVNGVLSVGGVAEWGGIGGGADWPEEAGTVDIGLVDFGVRGARREWNLGIGHSVGQTVGTFRSFLGGGVEVSRPFTQELAPDEGSPLRGLEVKPWLGGCMACDLANGVRLGMELKWAPDGATIVEGDDAGSEGRAGISLGFEW